MKTKIHRILSILLTVALLTSMLVVPVAAEEVTVVAWDYTAAPAAATVTATSGTKVSGAVLTNSQNVTPTYSSNSLSTGNGNGSWAGEPYQYWQISFSTLDYENLNIAAKTRSSNTGPKDFKLQYSLNGTDFYDVASSSYSIGGTGISNYMPTVSLPSAINNQAQVHIRFIMTSTTSLNNGTVAATGTSNINNIVITGTAVSGGPVETKCETPTAAPSAGAVFAGTQVTFASATAGAVIEYNTTTSAALDLNWTTGSAITVNTDATYYVRAVKDGLTTSDVETFTYTTVSSGTIATAKSAAPAAANVTATGVITYISGRNVYIQDNSGAICLFLNANNVNLKVGDLVSAAGTRTDYSNLIELTGISEANVTVLSHNNPIPDRGTATIAELTAQPDGKTAGYNHMCEVINISGATLSSTSMLSQGGSSITIYPAVNLANFPGISAGNTVDATVRMYDYNGTLEVEIKSITHSDGPLTVNASPASGDVVSGATVTLTGSKPASTIYYTTNGDEPTTGSTIYASPITISGNVGQTVTIKALAAKDGELSDVATFTYTIRDPNAVMNIKDVLALPNNTANVTVEGQIAYFATPDGKFVIQDVIGGQTYSLYIYGAAPDGAHVGDIVRLKGTYKLYSGLPEMDGLLTREIIGTSAPMAAEEVSIAYLKANGSSMLGRFVKIKNVTLGTYSSSSNTPVTDSTGTINIYRGAPYPTGVIAGDVVDLYAMVAAYTTTIQLYTGTAEANGFNVYDVVNDTKPPVVTLSESLEAKAGQDYTISADVSDNKGIQAVTITYTIGAVTKTAQAMVKNTGNGKYEYTIPGSEIVGTAANIKFTITATDVTGLTASSSEVTVAIDNKPRIVSVTPARNSATGANKTPEISVRLDNAGEMPTVKMTLKKDGANIVTDYAMTLKSGETTLYAYTPNTLADGKYTVLVTVTRSSDNQSITESWSFNVGEAQYKAYFGQLHGHTAEYSDGSGTLQNGLDYLANIPQSDKVDFVSFTDHSNYFDTTAAANPPEALNDKDKMTAESRTKWDRYVSTMTSFNSAHAGSLVALPGFEMTWSGGPGHINTFNSDGLISRNNTTLNDKKNDAGMKLYYETLIKDKDPLSNLSQFNHPGTTFGTFSDFAYWSPAYDNKMVAVEVGNGEGAINSGGYFPSYTEYTKALDKGWHVAPTNNQDNHKGKWGNSNTARTVIITDDLSSGGLLQGLKDRSVYSTEDKNLNISFAVNDQIMGSVIVDVPSTPLKFNVNIDDPDSADVISKVEIVTNSGRVAGSQTFTSNVADWEFELPAAKGYYYVRVTQADKNIAVTAPVWIGQAALMGINSVECGTKLPVTGEELTLTTKLFNNEAGTAKVKSVTYSQGSTVLTTKTLNTDIASMGTYTDTFSFIPAAAGLTTVTVTAVISLNGEDSEFTRDVQLDVRNSENMVYVGIDSSHYNEYVDGNYKDSMGNFAQMAADYEVHVVELKTGEALISATQNPKYKMLVLTPPTRRNGDNFLIGYKSYSDEEINAVADFAAAGGTVIVTGWADYYESYKKYSDGTSHTLPADQHMAKQQNRLLEALGATLRISDDEIKDDTKNGGQPQRLYLTNYNLENPYLLGVKPAEQVYSNYGGTTLYAVGPDGLPVQTLSDAVNPMVYAHDTSYSSDDDKDGYAGVTIPKYSGKFMVAASETVQHANGKTSTVIVAGSAFMSNFEIQAELDSYFTPAYSNYTILENVVRSIMNPVVISDIAEVQNAAEGETFTIRGIATSNASGYDKDTAFFDCIYVQDGTAGINAFPVAGNIRAGQTVEIKGTASSYNGERQILVTKATVIDESIKNLPTAISETTAQAANGANLGSLVKVTGTVVSMTTPNNIVESIYVRDSSGIICHVFIDGYITSTKTIANLSVGATLTATGLSSIDTEGARIRIRDRADIVCTVRPSGGAPIYGDTSTGNNQSSSDNKTEITVNETTTAGNKAPAIKATVEVKAVVGSDGKATSAITEKQVTDSIEKALEAAGKNEGSTLAKVEIKVTAPEGAKSIEVNLPKAAVTSAANSNISEMTVANPVADITFDNKSLEGISREATGDVKITAARAETGSLSEESRAAVGDHPVFSFSVTSGDKTISQFDGNVTVTVPYTPKAGEDTDAIVIYYINAQGNPEIVSNSVYDKETGTVKFTTGHFSNYAVGYNKVSFKDVAGDAWYGKAVGYIAARGITAGTGNGNFSPDTKLTRAEFLVMMMKAYDIKADGNVKDNFADAGSTYYTPYLATAKRLGISSGYGNNLFAPDREITREEMFTLLYNALKKTGKLPTSAATNKLTQYSDAGSISAWAKEAMTHLVGTGMVSGFAGLLKPAEMSTRAEMAQVLYNLLAK